MTVDDEVTKIAQATATAAAASALSVARAYTDGAIAAHVTALHGTTPVPPIPVPPVGGITAGSPIILPAPFTAANSREVWRFAAGPVGARGSAAAPGWNVFDGPARQNGEQAYFDPNQAEVVRSADGTPVLRFTMINQPKGGMPYTGAMMERLSYRIGTGKPWAVLCRQRWQPFWGAWVGPWLYINTAGAEREIDLAESINYIGPTFNVHNAQVGPQTGSKATRPSPTFDPWQFHDYWVVVLPLDRDGVPAGIYSLIDQEVRTHDGAWWAQQHVNGNEWPKYQLSCLGWWPIDHGNSVGKNVVEEIKRELVVPKCNELAQYVAYELAA